MTGLLIARPVDTRSADPLIARLCNLHEEADLEVREVLCPRASVDPSANIQSCGAPHLVVLELKHLNSPSNVPACRDVGGDVY